ncbi:MFS transporter [Chloroflexota bacterium]
MKHPVDNKNRRFFYGYIIIAAGILAGICIIGQQSVLGIFFKPISEEFDWTRATTSVVVPIYSLVMGISSVFMGRLTDKYGPRLVFIIAALAGGSGIMLMSQIRALWHFYLFSGFMWGITMGAADVPISTTVSRWFVRKRGMMVGITKAGAGVGMMLFPILANLFSSASGWRSAYLYLGSIVFSGILVAAFATKRDPAEMNFLPDGNTTQPTNETAAQISDYSLKDTLSSKQFWTFAGVWVIFLSCVQVTMTHLVNHVTDLGISSAASALIISVIGGFSILGRLSLTSLSDRIGPKSAYLIALALLASSMLWIQFSREVWMFYVFAAIYGTAHGAGFSLLAPMLSKLFGLNSLGTIMGFIILSGTIGGVFSPIAAGMIFDVTGTYYIAFAAMFAFGLLGILLLLSLKPMPEYGNEQMM